MSFLLPKTNANTYALYCSNLTRCFGLVRLEEGCPLNLGPGLSLPTWGMLLELCEVRGHR